MLKKEKAQQERRLFHNIKKFKPSFQARKDQQMTRDNDFTSTKR